MSRQYLDCASLMFPALPKLKRLQIQSATFTSLSEGGAVAVRARLIGKFYIS